MTTPTPFPPAAVPSSAVAGVYAVTRNGQTTYAAMTPERADAHRIAGRVCVLVEGES